MAQKSDLLSRRQDRTGQWLLETSKFQHWLDNKQRTLYCPGIQGGGKTMLATIIVDHLEQKFINEPCVGIVYLYCNFRQRHEQSIQDLLASLLKQLIQQQPTIPKAVRDLYDDHRKKQTRPSANELSESLQSVAAGFSRLFIVVDALDECQTSDGSRGRLLAEIHDLQAKYNTSFLATSRFIPDIMAKFDGKPSVEIRASVEDVQRYLKGHLARLPQFVSQNPDLQNEIISGITEAVDGMFLLAQLHLDSLIGKRSPKAIRIALQSLPTGSEAYDFAYKDAMERIEGQVPDQKVMAKQVLSWITCARRQLTMLELQHALAVEIGEPDLDEENIPDVEDMVSACAGLVTVDEQSNLLKIEILSRPASLNAQCSKIGQV